MRIHVLSAAIVISFAGQMAVAAEGCKGGARSQWKTVEQIKQVANEHGYSKIQKVILEDGCYEVVTINDQGKIVGVQFDPVTAKLHKIEAPR